MLINVNLDILLRSISSQSNKLPKEMSVFNIAWIGEILDCISTVKCGLYIAYAQCIQQL